MPSNWFPSAVFSRKLAAGTPLAADQTPALKVANQLNYSNKSYTYNGEAAPKFYGYSGKGVLGAEGFSAVASFKSATPAVYFMPPGATRIKVTFVNPTTGLAEPAGAKGNLQAGFNAVPYPDPTKIPHGQIWPEGTDKWVVIFDLATGEMWEMWRDAETEGAPTFKNGGYVPNIRAWNGIFPTQAEGAWGARASGLACVGGMLTHQDIIEVMAGGSIKHALAMALPVGGVSHVAPATRNDSKPHTATPETYKNEAEETVTNPAFGLVDAVAEGTWFRLPEGFDVAGHLGGTPGKLELAIGEAWRVYGWFVNDSGGNCQLYVEDTRPLGSPYSYSKVNPFYNGDASYSAYVNEFVPAAWGDAAAAPVTELMQGKKSVLFNLSQKLAPSLQVLEPFSS